MLLGRAIPALQHSAFRHNIYRVATQIPQTGAFENILLLEFAHLNHVYLEHFSTSCVALEK